LDQVTDEVKQNVSVKAQRLSGYMKLQNKGYKKKLVRTDCKKFYSLLTRKNSNVKNTPNREERLERNIWEKGAT
jgi:hypothetical protein